MNYFKSAEGIKLFPNPLQRVGGWCKSMWIRAGCLIPELNSLSISFKELRLSRYHGTELVRVLRAAVFTAIWVVPRLLSSLSLSQGFFISQKELFAK